MPKIGDPRAGLQGHFRYSSKGVARPQLGPFRAGSAGAQSRAARAEARYRCYQMQGLRSCLSCGTCCFSTLPEYARVDGRDHSRLGTSAQTLVAFDGHRAFMRMTNGHCSALVIGKRTGEFVCSVYETRPQICRDLGRGSAECLGELHAKSERSTVELSRLRKQ